MCSVLPYLQYRSFKLGLFATGIYFILGTCNLFSLTPSTVINSYYVRLGSLDLSTPTFQPLSFGLLMLYLIVNFNSFVTIYLDYEFKDNEKKAKANKDLLRFFLEKINSNILQKTFYSSWINARRILLFLCSIMDMSIRLIPDYPSIETLKGGRY